MLLTVLTPVWQTVDHTIEYLLYIIIPVSWKPWKICRFVFSISDLSQYKVRKGFSLLQQAQKRKLNFAVYFLMKIII